jgi:hypothetical protein
LPASRRTDPWSQPTFHNVSFRERRRLLDASSVQTTGNAEPICVLEGLDQLVLVNFDLEQNPT